MTAIPRPDLQTQNFRVDAIFPYSEPDGQGAGGAIVHGLYDD